MLRMSFSWGALVPVLPVVFAIAATDADARNICFAENQCDFRGFACVSEVEECQGALGAQRQKATAAQREYKRLSQENRTLRSELQRTRTQLREARAAADRPDPAPVSLQEEEAAWMRERDKVVGDYAAFMLCVREADTLDRAKGCFDK